MKFGDDTRTHPARAVDPQQFRAQATGIGQTRQASLATGGMRAQRVVDQTPEGCRTWPENEGFPPTTDSMLAAVPSTLVVTPTRVRGVR